jgi:hypothetical protein
LLVGRIQEEVAEFVCDLGRLDIFAIRGGTTESISGVRAEPEPAVSQFAGAESGFSRKTSWFPQDSLGPARLVYLNCERVILTKARPSFSPSKSAEKTSKIRRNKLMRNIKTTVTLATLVAVGAMIGLRVTFARGTCPKYTLKK